MTYQDFCNALDAAAQSESRAYSPDAFPNNGGKERVARDGETYYINSYINANIGWMGERKVSRIDAECCMSYTNAPANVVAAILG